MNSQATKRKITKLKKSISLMTIGIGLSLFSPAVNALHAQAHGASTEYQKPTNPKVLENLSEWQDLKFGLMMHWGTYSQWGVVESWSICPEDEPWEQRDPKHGKTYFEYVKNYENLQTTFNPTDFNPEKWAKAAKAAGMRYVVFTTKHHDGFAMFDTQFSDYKITSEKTPFHTNPQADVTKAIFNTFRDYGFKIGAYYSKPDWHSDDYWWPYFPPKDRNVNYNPLKYPERWNKFKNFVYNQINELTTNYGRIDILWLDGGWVRPKKQAPDAKRSPFNQDIDMDRIGQMARENQPGILVVDRTVPGKWENYVTPEQSLPDQALSVPWESCITMGNSFSYVPNDEYKTPQKIIETLVKIISRGGNYLLNVAPGPNGDFDPIAYQRLEAIGKWMDINHSAVYATRSTTPDSDGNYYYTKSKDGKTLNVFHLNENEKYKAPAEMKFSVPEGFKVRKLKVLGLSKVSWKQSGTSVHVKLPEERERLQYATTVQITKR